MCYATAELGMTHNIWAAEPRGPAAAPAATPSVAKPPKPIVAPQPPSAQSSSAPINPPVGPKAAGAAGVKRPAEAEVSAPDIVIEDAAIDVLEGEEEEDTFGILGRMGGAAAAAAREKREREERMQGGPKSKLEEGLIAYKRMFFVLFLRGFRLRGSWPKSLFSQ